jgi:hypothetical protein
MADFCGTCECDFIHIHVTCNRRAGCWTKSGQQIQNSFRKSRFHYQLADAER